MEFIELIVSGSMFQKIEKLYKYFERIKKANRNEVRFNKSNECVLCLKEQIVVLRQRSVLVLLQKLVFQKLRPYFLHQ